MTDSTTRPVQEAGTTADEVTILLCGQGHRATKTFVANPDGTVDKQNYDAGMYFGVLRKPVANLADLSRLLLALEKMPEAFVIRGAPTLPIPPTGLRRKKEDPANFRTPDAGRRWVLIDFDQIPVPSGLELSTNPRAVVEHLVSLLPEEFADCSYHYQLSSSAGLGDPNKASAHVWFWLSEPWTDSRLKAWAHSVNEDRGYHLIDTALFNDVQVHYTAAPLFEGIQDPIRERSALVMKERDAVSIQYTETPSRPRQHAGPGAFAPGVGFEGWLERIGDHAGGEGFHGAIIRAIASYVSEHGSAGTDAESLYQVVRERVLAADRSRHDTAYVEGMASRGHIMEAIEGAMKKFGDVPSARRPSRFLPELAASTRPPELSGAEAHSKLSAVLDDIFGASA